MRAGGRRLTEEELAEIGKHVDLTHGRLGECYSAFMLFKEIERTREVSPFMVDPNTRYGDFWREVHLCAISKAIIDICALVDKRKDVASLCSLYRLCVKIHSTHCIQAKHYIDEVRETWEKYRHKLIGHNDASRDVVMTEFANEGFTVERMEEEIGKLGFAFNVLFAVFCGQEPPRFEDGLSQDAYFVTVGEKVRFDTRSFLDAVAQHLPQIVG
jgi:hypothetical protein